MRIVIIDAFHDSDRGGAGILAGLLNLLSTAAKRKREKLEVSVIYRFSEKDKRFYTAARHTRKTFPDISIYGTLFPTSPSHAGLGGKLNTTVKLLQSLVLLIIPDLSCTGAIKALKSADCVISKGGHFYQFREKNSFRGLIGAYRVFYDLLLALRLRKKIYLIAHTIGPFENVGSKMVAKFVFDRVNFLSTREAISKQILSKLGVKSEKIHVIPDTAFALRPASRQELSDFLKKKGLEAKRYAVFTPRYWTFPDATTVSPSQLYKNYILTLAYLGDYLLNRRHVDKVVLVRHNNGQHDPKEDDLKPCKEIFERMSYKNLTLLIEEDLSPAMQAAFYGSARIVIGVRMHSVIFALVGGAPALAIGYTHKTKGIMEMLGLERYCVEIDKLDFHVVQRKVEAILAEEANIMHFINVKIHELRSKLETQLEELLFPGGEAKQ